MGLSAPGQNGQITLVGPDGSQLPCDATSVAGLKQKWCEFTSSPLEYVSLTRQDGALVNDDSDLKGVEELKVMYTLAGGGFQCQPNFKCETGWPGMCALGFLFEHCWCVPCGDLQAMVMAQKACCGGYQCF